MVTVLSSPPSRPSRTTDSHLASSVMINPTHDNRHLHCTQGEVRPFKLQRRILQRLTTQYSVRFEFVAILLVGRARFLEEDELTTVVVIDVRDAYFDA
ncbi:hypothetical protein CC2G_003576 [Coprinopsis cinerea AmutBmut pab1-1]|nr:hypothetical protein CC2G_003576 [Coprinopsis cinerea AmutBmut pab1-1]